MIKKGQHLRIKIAGKFIAFAQDCTVHIANQTEDSSTKDTTDGMWAKNEITGKSWDISANALYSVDEDATGMNAEEALDIALANAPVQVEFVMTSGEQNRTASGVKYTGSAIVNDISVSAPNRQNASYQISMNGDGPLVKSGTSNNSNSNPA